MACMLSIIILVSMLSFNNALGILCKDKRDDCQRQCHRTDTLPWLRYVIKNCMKTCGYCTNENVALNKKTSQSSTYIDTNDIPAQSLKAVDGITDGNFRKGSCTHTNKETNSWWCVDLQKRYKFDSVVLYNRNNNKDRLEGFSISISETGNCDQESFSKAPVCYTDRSIRIQDKYTIQRCNENNGYFSGRYLFVSVPNDILTLCEVQIFYPRCSDGYYSYRSTCKQCPCLSKSCDHETGVCNCKNCQNENCDRNGKCRDKCIHGYYGDGCTDTCSIQCNDGICDVHGRCINGCNAGYYGDNCTNRCPIQCKDGTCDVSGRCIHGCNDGYYGDSCADICSNQCKDGTCDVHGTCINGCIDGYYADSCADTCSMQCKGGMCGVSGKCINGCKDGYYGDRCTDTCSTCLGSCNQTNGKCKSGCKDGYWGSGGLCKLSCSNCKPGGCNMTTGNCNTGCTEGWYNQTCKQKCSSRCIDGCSSITGYCTQCETGRYGNMCDKTCSVSCNGGCSKRKGVCAVCVAGRYGDYCNKTCGVGCQGNQCSKSHGTCQCKDIYYGHKCNGVCSSKCINRKCNTNAITHSQPICTLGCVDHYQGSYCQTPCDNNCLRCNSDVCSVCQEGRYDNKCQSRCSSDCVGGCKIADGKCNNCKQGSFGDYCNVICSDGCLPTVNQVVCNRDGRCSVGCIDGRYGEKCDQKCSLNCDGGCDRISARCRKCISGYHGNNCDQSCSLNCDGECDRNSSNCNTCMSGYYGERCNQICSSTCDGECVTIYGYCVHCLNGYYGNKCERNCSKNCINSTCDKYSASCTGGCVNGKKGSRCNTDCRKHCISCQQDSPHRCLQCEDGWKGTYCNSRCSVISERCNTCQQSGQTCLTCQQSWFGSRCDQQCLGCLDDICDINGDCMSCKQGLYGSKCNKNCSKSCKDPPDGIYVCHHITGTCNGGCKAGKIGSNCSEDCLDGQYGEYCSLSCGDCKEMKACDIVTGSCGQNGCADEYTGPTCHTLKNDSSLSIVLSLLFVIIVIVVVAILIFRWRKNRNDVVDNNTTGLVKIDSTEVPVYYDNLPGTSNDSIYQNIGKKSLSPTQIELIDLWAITQRRKKSDSFTEEFQKLPSGLCSPHTVALSPEHKSKNRYKMICAFDHTRVKLNIENGDPTSDYVNACYITGYHNESPEYIASQGPIPVNIIEFWRMIWDVKTEKIVILTNLTEMGIIKCTRYWPLLDKEIRYGKISITMIQEEIFANFTIRTLRVSKDKCGTRLVIQYHYTSWPDKSVPSDISSLVEFRNKVTQSLTELPGPMVVHCSAGVGRTGTFIALDYLIKEGTSRQAVDVYSCVLQMRYERVNMVQTKEQYIFIHDALAEWYLSEEATTTVTEYHQVYQDLLTVSPQSGKTKLQDKFEIMSEHCSASVNSDYAAAINKENKTKNRCSRILAFDKCRPYLTTQVSNSTDYINAVYLPSHLQKLAYILTQTPMNNTLVDFIRLIVDADVHSIVDLDFNMSITSKENVGKYLPVTNKAENYGPFKVTSSVEDDTNDMFTVYKYTVVSEGEEEKTFTVYKCHFWQNDTIVPASVSPILYLLEHITCRQTVSSNSTYRPILVHCLNGVNKGGLFCVLAAMLERLVKEQSVNVVQIINQLRLSRPQIIPTYEQFKFCFDAIGEYLERFSNYASLC